MDNIDVSKKARVSILWETSFPPVASALFWTTEYREHPDRLAGKKGDYEAARRLVNERIDSKFAEKIFELYAGSLIVPVMDIESEGINELPEAFAERLALLTGLSIDYSIFKTNKTSHATAKYAIERLVTRAVFDGKVQTERPYLIVDDFVSLGGTIADLRHYIGSSGGKVAGVATIGASNEDSLWLPPKKDTIQDLERIDRDGIESILQEYGIAYRLEDLTNAEAGAIRKLARWLEGRQSDILLGIRARFDAAVERENTKTP